MKKTTVIIIAVIIVSLAAGAYLYPRMPDTMPSHWNAQGEVDGYLPKLWGLFLMPIISVVILGLFLLIPLIDPLKANIEKFRKQFDAFIVIFIFFLMYVHSLTILWSFDFRFNMSQMMIPALAVLFYYVGLMTGRAKRNWFIGIRTPWTLSSERVWNRTHQLGGRLIKLSAAASLIGLYGGRYAVWLALAPIISVMVFLVVYSYLKFRKEGRRPQS